MAKISIIIGLLLATIAAPFLLRPANTAGLVADDDAERLVIISPHNESIQSEFTLGFVRHMKEKHSRNVYIDWRQPGGTSEIAMFLKSEYANAFENLWKKVTNLSFTTPIRDAFTNGRLDSRITEDSTGYNARLNRVQSGTQQGAIEDRTLLSREMFLRSDAGVGIDLFFGGGAYDFTKQAAAGALVATDSSGQYGPGALAKQHPDWFGEDIMPATVSGEPFRDPEFRWVGTVLSSFGLCYNKDIFIRLGVEPPEQWVDLTNPKLFGQIALADPTKSGSATKAYEMLIQQKIRAIFQSMQMQARDIGDIEADAVEQGWDEAMRMILKISANGRYFTNDATKVPRDVAQGEAGAGMCIDFYGRTYNEIKKKADGTSRIEFVMPENGTSIGADPIGLLRGAPHPELAHRFIEYVLSIDGQKLWNYRTGAPGGPVRFALRRPPIRKDFYTPEHMRYMTDGDVNVYELSKDFTYEGKWTGAAFNSLRFAIRCSCVDTHIEQRAAWQAIITSGMPADALHVFEDVSAINYEKITGEIGDTLASKDKIKEVALARDLSSHFREKYRKVIELCDASQRKTRG
ncbi:MAG: extracellular solute-binding protein [Verrucomicrobiales bacterium]|nr:extracellular solute-binding protein [Verrucomicrobiales bacterium]